MSAFQKCSFGVNYSFNWCFVRSSVNVGMFLTFILTRCEERVLGILKHSMLFVSCGLFVERKTQAKLNLTDQNRTVCQRVMCHDD